MNKPVKLRTQLLGSILIPSGIYCYYRIGKLVTGLIIYAGSFLLSALPFLLLSPNIPMDYLLRYEILGNMELMTNVIGFIIPLIFIYKYSKEYNERLKINECTK